MNESCKRVLKLINTMGCGNDLTPESATWLAEHLQNCSDCHRRYANAVEILGYNPI